MRNVGGTVHGPLACTGRIRLRSKLQLVGQTMILTLSTVPKLSCKSSKYVLDLQTTFIRTLLQFQTAKRPFRVVPDTRPQPRTIL